MMLHLLAAGMFPGERLGSKRPLPNDPATAPVQRQPAKVAAMLQESRVRDGDHSPIHSAKRPKLAASKLNLEGTKRTLVTEVSETLAKAFQSSVLAFLGRHHKAQQRECCVG